MEIIPPPREFVGRLFVFFFFQNHCNCPTVEAGGRGFIQRPHGGAEISVQMPSLRGRRLKGKGKGVLGARETRGGARGGLCFPRSLPPCAPLAFPSCSKPPFLFKRLPRRLHTKIHLKSQSAKRFFFGRDICPLHWAIKSNGNLIRPDLKKFKCRGVAQGVAKGSKCVVLF